MMATTYQDVRYALRMMRKNPVLSMVIIGTLALGIGANAAMFSLTDRVLLQKLPVANPDQLAIISTLNPGEADGDQGFSYPMYQDLRDRNDVFNGVIARGGVEMNVSYGDQTERIAAELVSGNFFEVLGVRPWAGRLLTQDDDRNPSAHPVAVISYGFWQKRFGGDPSIIGKTVLANEHPLTVLGVTPPGFYGLYLSGSPDVWVPLMMTPVFNPLPPTRLTSRRHQWLSLMARRKEGISIERAQASLAVLYHQIREGEAAQAKKPLSDRDKERFLARRISLSDGGQGFQSLRQQMRTALLLLLGATGIVLLILCANLTNLMMARATVRAPEMAVRLALGAGRLRLLRQWLTEGLLLSLAGGFAGVFVAVWIKAGLMFALPGTVNQNLNEPFGLRFAGFVIVVTIVVGLLFSLAPAIQAARGASLPSLHLESRSFTSAAKLVSLRSGLILMQVALSLPLLIGALLLLRTLQNLRAVDTGFGKDNVLLASVNPSLNGYSAEKSRLFFSELLARTRALPGVTAASVASDSPLSGGWDRNTVVVEGYTPKEDEKMDIDATNISSDYFRTLDIPLTSGRDFTAEDTIGSPKVVIINELMARHFFGAANPIGKRIGLEKLPDRTIVGVVKDAKYVDLRQPMRRHFYSPIMQEENLFGMVLQARTSGSAESISAPVRNQVQEIDPHLPLYDVMTLQGEIDRSLTPERLLSWLTTSFGLLATVLVALGLYGVLTFSVARRTREIGIRVALGAQRRDVFLMVMKHGFLLVLAGAIIGTFAAVALSRIVSGLLFGISPTNTAVFAGAGLGLIAIALLACYFPARRATRVDPLVALRYE
ncbi:MAG TPA: ABC transporter permease [Pyrinomonadaceae bacterium]|nr:ABC transporter permease [Pyrinomonadaceae bacterium]